MGKACGIIAALGIGALMLFCGFGALAFREAQKQIAETEAKMTPAEKAEREERRQKEKDRASQRASEIVMIRATEAVVTKMLKTPSVAKFTLEAATYDKRLVLVSGHVDSQNSFGAMLRTDVMARYVDGKLAAVTLGDEQMKGDLYDESQHLIDAWKAANKK